MCSNTSSFRRFVLSVVKEGYRPDSTKQRIWLPIISPSPAAGCCVLVRVWSWETVSGICPPKMSSLSKARERQQFSSTFNASQGIRITCKATDSELANDVSAASHWIALAINSSSLQVWLAGGSFCLASTRASVRARCSLMCKMNGFTDALRICKIINYGQFAEHKKKTIFAIGERAYSTLPYSEIITAVSCGES